VTHSSLLSPKQHLMRPLIRRSFYTFSALVAATTAASRIPRLLLHQLSVPTTRASSYLDCHRGGRNFWPVICSRNKALQFRGSHRRYSSPCFQRYRMRVQKQKEEDQRKKEGGWMDLHFPARVRKRQDTFIVIFLFLNLPRKLCV
jgi:hypothetical protein